ncbi:MAG: hypothetical protein WCF10_09485 [Polyangiales bacterium]
MARAFIAILVIAAMGCGNEVDLGVADPGGVCGFGVQDCHCDTDADCDTSETCVEADPGSTVTICRYAPESGAGGFGGDGGAGGLGGEGGPGGVEQPATHPIPMIRERFRGQVSIRTRPKNTNKTRCRTFL